MSHSAFGVFYSNFRSTNVLNNNNNTNDDDVTYKSSILYCGRIKFNQTFLIIQVFFLIIIFIKIFNNKHQ